MGSHATDRRALVLQFFISRRCALVDSHSSGHLYYDHSSSPAEAQREYCCRERLGAAWGNGTPRLICFSMDSRPLPQYGAGVEWEPSSAGACPRRRDEVRLNSAPIVHTLVRRQQPVWQLLMTESRRHTGHGQEGDKEHKSGHYVELGALGQGVGVSVPVDPDFFSALDSFGGSSSRSNSS